jgi:nitrous oxide reductase
MLKEILNNNSNSRGASVSIKGIICDKIKNDPNVNNSKFESNKNKL